MTHGLPSNVADVLDLAEQLIEEGLDLCNRYRAVKKHKPCIEDDLNDLLKKINALKNANFHAYIAREPGETIQLIDLVKHDELVRRAGLIPVSEL